MTTFREADHPRATTGVFTDKEQSAPELTLTARPYADNTPSEVDEILNGLSAERGVILDRIDGYRNAIARYEKRLREEEKSGQEGFFPQGRPEEKIAELEKSIAAAEEKVEALNEKIAPLDDEFDARGGWSRFYITTGSDPHVHSSKSCTSCYPTTRYGWLTDNSGMSEEEIVELGGDSICTVCFPSAPVADKSRPRTNRLETPEAKAARIQREQEEAARALKKAATAITSPDGQPIVDGHGSAFKTERGAELDALSGLNDIIWYGSHDYEPRWLRVAADVEDAIAAKHGISVDDVRAKWRKSMEAKAKREGIRDRWEQRKDTVFQKLDAFKAARDVS